MKITLNAEQEQFLQEQLNTGKYGSVNEVITSAFKLLQEKEKQEKSRQLLTIVGGEVAENLLAEKLKKLRQELQQNQDKNLDPHRYALAEEFRKLCTQTQALHADNPLTPEEIAAEIEAYRRGE
jgi:antitoxin ParD1/3/4